MGLSIFGSNSKDTHEESEIVNNESQLKVGVLQAELADAKARLKESASTVEELRCQLAEYESRERQIAEVMISAQISAQQTEAQARSKAETLLQETDEELRRKHKELELLQMKTQLFKQEMNDRLELYKSSLEQAMEASDDVSFTPTLVAKERKNGQKMIG